MLPTTDIAALQQALDFRALRRGLRSSGGLDLFWGIAAIVMGVLGFATNPINAVLVVIGLLLLVVGALNLAMPMPIGLVLEGIALIIVGIWNIGVSILNLAAGASPTFVPILGIIQIGLAIQSFSRYRRYSYLAYTKPAEPLLQWADTAIKALLKLKEKSAPSALEFQTSGFVARRWKAQLFEQMVLFADARGADVLVAPRGAAQILPKSKVLLHNSFKAKFQINGRTMNGTISGVSLERYQAWNTTSN